MNKILIITPFFAPETHAAVFRAHKLAKYLYRYDWEVHVLTTDINYNYNEDIKLLKELENVRIHRARYIEPTFRGIKMALGGEDRTYKTLTKNSESNINNNSNENIIRNILSVLIKWIQEDVLRVVDRYWTWERNAIRLGKKIVREYDIKLLFCTCPGLTQGAVALNLKDYFNLPLVVDFRDPIITVRRNHSQNDRIFFRQRRLKKKLFEHADIVTTASFSHNLILHDLFKGENYDKIKFIPTGLDVEYLPKDVSPIENTIVYTGEYLIENGFEFFELFAALISDDNSRAFEYKVKIFGNIDINKRLLSNKLKELNILDYIDFIDHLPQKKLYDEIRKAKAGLLQSRGNWWCSFSKMIDYIALEKPVLAFVPSISESNTMLRKAGLLIEFGESFEENKKILKDFMSNNYELKVNKEFIKRYKSSYQVSQFVELFNNLVK